MSVRPSPQSLATTAPSVAVVNSCTSLSAAALQKDTTRPHEVATELDQIARLSASLLPDNPRLTVKR
jgi:hypothetical protein